MREREMPFIPRHSHPETSHQAAAIQPPFTESRTIMEARISREKTWSREDTLGHYPQLWPKVALITHKVAKEEVRKNLRLTPQDQQHLCSGSAPSDAVPDAHRCSTRVPPPPVPVLRPLI